MKTIKINSSDNVLIALNDLEAGTKPECNIVLKEHIPAGHKIAIKDIKKEEAIIKYGEIIGYAKKDIREGEWVHTHNIKTGLSDVADYSYHPSKVSPFIYPVHSKITGYKRKNNKVGLRNELWILVTVGCVNSIANHIVDLYKRTHDISDIDGIFTFNHPYGCSQMGQDQENTKIILKRIAEHPNAGGVLLLGLGCENNQVLPFYKSLEDIDTERIRYMNCQDVEDETSTAIHLLEELHANMKKDKRVPIHFKDIKIGLKCGGSDGFSGITANPLVGKISDIITQSGGSTILSEVPEMFGAEHILMNRAENTEVFNKIIQLINQYKNYLLKHDQVIYENPSPGNKKGGISTLEEKSLGCIQKAGNTSVEDVLKYGETVTKSGISLLYGPGNDMVSVTALAASGAQLVLFTTGRGTPFGGFVPTLKIATNTKLSKQKKNWIDFNAGTLLDLNDSNLIVQELIDKIISVINGEKTKNEVNNCREVAIFKQGVTL